MRRAKRWRTGRRAPLSKFLPARFPLPLVESIDRLLLSVPAVGLTRSRVVREAVSAGLRAVRLKYERAGAVGSR